MKPLSNLIFLLPFPPILSLNFSQTLTYYHLHHFFNQFSPPQLPTMAATSCFHALSTPARSSQSSSSHRMQAPIKPNQLIICRSQKRDEATTDGASISRRLALTVLIGAAAVGTKVSPADAAYGEAANVFGKQKSTEFTQYAGPGFKLAIPAKWNPSKEVEYPGQVLRYEDNFDTTSNLAVMVTPTDKKSITDYGAPEDFLSKVDYLLGKQAYFGKTASEVTA